MKTIIIADDTTGANASGILLKKLRLNVLTVNKDLDNSSFDKISSDALCVSLDSRACSKEEAYERVSTIMDKFANLEPIVYNKRIDSTLRGNLGSELDGMLDKTGKKAVIVACFPGSGRITLGGIMYVNDVLLEKTEVAKDPKMPINSSNVKELFAKQTNRKIDNIYLSTVREGVSVLKDSINNVLASNDIVVVDAITEEDVKNIALSCANLNYDIITVDPGPFTMHLTEAKISAESMNSKIVYMIGSVVETIINQMRLISSLPDFELIYVNPAILLTDKAEEELNRAYQKAISSKERVIVMTSTDVNNPVLLDLPKIGIEMNKTVDEVSDIINDHLASLLIRVVDHYKGNLKGIFTSGGDTTVAFLKQINCVGLNLLKEVMPLAVCSTIQGGAYQGLTLVTKGGTIGNVDALSTIAKFIEEEVV